MNASSAVLGARKRLWRVGNISKSSRDGLEELNTDHSKNHTKRDGPSLAMIFGSIFGSFVAISLLQRMWPRKVEIIHSYEDGKSSSDRFRSV